MQHYVSYALGMGTYLSTPTLPPPPTYVTSVQQVSITIGSGATSNTATISSVDTSKTFLVYQGITFAAANDAADTVATRVTLTNATTVTATRTTSDTEATTITVTVIEASSQLVSSVQYGTVTITGSTTGTATISSVDLTKSAVFWLGTSTSSTQTSVLATRGFTAVDLTNATTVTATQAASSYDSVTSFVVVVFDASAIDSVQEIAQSETNGSTTNGETITSATQANTMLAFGGYFGASGQGRLSQSYIQQSSDTNINMVNGEAINTLQRQVNYTVIEFVAGVLASTPQQGTISLVSTTSNTATISSVNTNKTICAWLGAISTGSGTTNEDAQWQKLTLTNATTITGTVDASAARGQAVAYGVYEFN